MMAGYMIRTAWAGGGVLAVWQRNSRVWRRSWKTSLVAAVGDPLLYFLGLGYGLNTLIPAVDGIPYLHYVVPGLMLSSTMYSATIEATYSVFTKMEYQKVYASMLLAPLAFEEIVVGEMLWVVTKGVLSGGTVLLLAILAGLGDFRVFLPGIFLLVLTGVIFAALGFIATSLADGYETFNYYFTLLISPMFFFSGIFFPVERLGSWLETVAWCFPLTHLTILSRALFHGGDGRQLFPEILWLTIFTALTLWVALRRMTRRFAG